MGNNRITKLGIVGVIVVLAVTLVMATDLDLGQAQGLIEWALELGNG